MNVEPQQETVTQADPIPVVARYRVRMSIYSFDSSAENPEVWTDEPLFVGNGEEEMVAQAHRTHRKFITHLATDQ